MEPRLLLKAAKARGLDGVAVTDHNTIRGALAAKKLARSIDIKVIVGEEVKTTKGDLIGYNLSKEISCNTPLEDAIDDIHDQGGVACAPHPLDVFRTSAIGGRALERVKKKLDMIEAYNGRNFFLLNAAARDFALRNRLPMTAGSDAHFYPEVGRAWTLIDDAEELKPKGRGCAFSFPLTWLAMSLRSNSYKFLRV